MTTEEFDPGDAVRLDGAQARLREAFFERESGLFVLESDPGAGKSTTSEHVAAEYLARSHASGAVAPEESLAFVSFTRDDAADIGPGIADALSELAADPERDIGLTRRDAEELGRRVRRASHVGTVDSVLGAVFSTIAREVGYGDAPTVGDGASVRRVHAACLRRLRADEDLEERFRRLQSAYPGGEYRSDAAELLLEAHRTCRERRLAARELRDRLEAVVEATYPDGPPDSVRDVLGDVAAFVDDGTAERYAPRIDDADADVVAADRDRYDEWRTAVEDLCALVEAYTSHYDDLAREEGVASYLDVAHWVARFFTEDEYAGEFRDRLRARYTEQFDVVVVDEAQDVSAIQHAALAELVPENARVLLVGDRKQGIFQWRNAHPQLFQTAIDDGEYFGIEWDTHVVEHEPRTRRCRPGVAAAVDAVYADVFTDSARGRDATTADDYTPLEPTREDASAPNVHVAPVTAAADPGDREYVSATRGVGEATALARCIARGLDTGAFDDPDAPATDTPSVTVLVPHRMQLDEFKDAFEDAGLGVGDATGRLFAHPLVEAVVAVTAWLSTLDEADATRTLAGDPVFEDTNVPAVLELHDYAVRAVAAVDDDRPPFAFVRGLDRLRRQRHRLSVRSVAHAVETVVDELDLYADPLDLATDPSGNVTALDRLIATVSDRADGGASLSDLAAQFEYLRESPARGPDLPADADRDVVFKTIYQMKGDEDDVVALADVGNHLGLFGAHGASFDARGPHLALAPPPVDAAANAPALPGFDRGLFDADASFGEYDAGLRWVTHRWNSAGDLAGSPPLRALAAAERAEQWRLLYVALTRARNHLVVPLPTDSSETDARDYWIETLREAFRYDGAIDRTYECDAPTGSFPIRSHDPTEAPDERSAESASVPSSATPSESEPRPWTPRFVSPSTLHPLRTDPETHVLDHLQRRPLHSDHDGVSDDVPLTFETMGPDDVGDIAHQVLATAVRNDVDTETLRSCTGPVAARLRSLLGDRADAISAHERDALEAYVGDTLCPQFAATRIWNRAKAADAVYVEEPLETLVRVADIDVELQGTADLVLEDSAGRWHVEELKITLQPLDEDTRERYRLQTRAYAQLLSEHLSDDVTAGITRLGVDPATRSVSTDRIELDGLRELF